MKRIAKFLISILLWSVAVGLIFPLTVVNFCFVWQKNGTVKGYFLSTVASIDRWANSEFRTLWNSVLIRPDASDYFGDVRETISSVLGKNQITETLTLTGRILAGILDLLDKNHCKNSIVYYK
ncbi:hypothetical protein QIU18_13075 [Capnocytophaga canimorsus]|nr:hypothetical protein [Capnocytophaga canimorsus]WGU68545.1 hypothetical protein QIU19_00485 [Capnocytophaga canimorsus]WGU70350.1 hypothetical protein QIU18_13075 [Capnocytophaga canimorsus]